MDNPKKRLLSQATQESANGDESATTAAASSTAAATTSTTTTNDNDVSSVIKTESGEMQTDEAQLDVENNSTTTTLPVAKRPHVDLNARSAAKAEAAGVFGIVVALVEFAF
jgi:hypothetical protein